MLTINPIKIETVGAPSFKKNKQEAQNNYADEQRNNTKRLLLSLTAVGIACLGGIYAKHKYDEKWAMRMQDEATRFAQDLRFRRNEYKGIFDYSKDMEYYFNACHYTFYPTKKERLENMKKLNDDVGYGKVLLRALKEDKNFYESKYSSKELEKAIKEDKDFIKASRIFKENMENTFINNQPNAKY